MGLRRIILFIISFIFSSICALALTNRVGATVAADGLDTWQIAVVKETSEGRASIDLLDHQGGMVKTIIEPGRTWALTWSADGQRLAFMSDRDVSGQAQGEKVDDPFYQPPGHLFVINLIDGMATQITDGASKAWLPRLSPDGRQVAFLSDRNSRGDLYVSPTQQPLVTRLTVDKNWPLEGALWFSSSELMFNSFVDDTLQVFRMNVIDQVSRRVELDAPPHSKAGYLAVSHDRKQLAFDIRDRDLDAKKGIINPQLYVIALNDGHRRRLTFDDSVSYSPSWSPDDQWIAFLRQVETKDGPRASLYVIRGDGQYERLVATSVTSSPSWLTNNNVLVYTAYVEQHHGLFVFDMDSGTVTRIGDHHANYQGPTTREGLAR